MIDRRACFICAWRATCQKRYTVSSDMNLNVNCPDYSRDVTIRDVDVDRLLVEEQLEKWKKEKKPKYPFVLTVSRESGSGGNEISRLLAQGLGMDLMGGQIIQKVAESSKMSTRVIESLDEKAVSALDSLVNSMFSARSISGTEYFRHLTQVILTIGKHGNAIIVGRGAHMILPKEETFRLRVIAPMALRVHHLMKSRSYTKKEAEEYIKKRDGDRLAFLKKHFQTDPADPLQYDMVINTEKIGLEAAAEAVKAAFLAWANRRLREEEPARRAKAN
ncbi:MAG TPA: cytidylate kinase-like family protein [Syntrophales bacterium]|nr:cytidylate kinase-like family protein [Syntrophales bacterium]HOX93697.1 cytidylate kinase-like family protein [Syntrophales bacterium]HPI56565.1 cytidylate kinase-like family protein [Syntrophales bacterium]HPN25014.1 cytidylate kinase-like family protein [Syntrophales bacterium]HQM29244.1 cytidylate kinase-like family protein [Syntrophales bacterium]